MQQSSFADVKINNEIELCEVSSQDCRHMIERQLLKHRISYFVRWPKESFFSRKKDSCIICVNSIVRDEAESIVRAVCDESGHTVRFLFKKSQNEFL